MKILFLSNGTTHYYNLVLNRLNSLPGFQLALVAPAGISPEIGEGVHLSRDGITFKVYELPERTRFRIYLSFCGLAKLLWREKPNVVIVSGPYLMTFVFNIPVILSMKLLNIKLICKTIPFRISTYQAAKIEVQQAERGFKRVPTLLNRAFAQLGIDKLIRLLYLELRKLSFNIPDAHVNYVDEAYRILGSYGVRKERIFVTRNSPDTDLLFSIRQSLQGMSPILPTCEHRLIHVGRLVDWKRVDLLLRAFARIRRGFSDAELLIIGSGPEEGKLKALSAELGFGGEVKFLGGIHDYRLLGRYLMSSTIYVLAGMGGLSINDAMCFGLPVICSVGDGTEKVLVRDEFNGKYFRDGDEEDLAEKIIYLLQNPELRRQMGRNSTAIIRNEINIHTVIDGYRRAIEFVLNGRTR